MSLDLQQTDEEAGFALQRPPTAPANRKLINEPLHKVATLGGLPGAVPVFVEIPYLYSPPTSDAYLAAAWVSAVGEPGLTTWSAGLWTVALKVSAPKTNFFWIESYICRIDSSNVIQEVLANDIGRAPLNMGNIQIDEVLVTEITTIVPTTASPSDRIYVVLAFFNTNVGPPQSIGLGVDQIINAPFGETFTVRPATVAMAMVIHTPTVKTSLTVLPLAIVSVATILQPTVVLPDFVVQPATVESNATIFEPTVSVGGTFTVQPETIQATATINEPTVSGGGALFHVFDGTNFIIVGGEA